MKKKLNRELKLLKTDEFSSVFNFKKRYHTPLFVLHFKNNTKQRARIGLVVPKRIEKSAVQRNYMRRVFRELFRTNSIGAELGYDLVIRVQKSFSKNDFKRVEQLFNQLLLKLQNNIDVQ